MAHLSMIVSTALSRQLRSVPAKMITGEYADVYWLCHDAAAEIERLVLESRMTLLEKLDELYEAEEKHRCSDGSDRSSPSTDAPESGPQSAGPT